MEQVLFPPVEDSSIATLQFLEKMGMKNTINQYEMLLELA